ncbi:zinc-ribbon domain-containing protein [Peribacillus sp. NPDC097206]|uniref:zinc-ribbon domain-containing protein n=1 Tax=unclassified Peribacillus TaxID=2675266 RepID=UPI00380080E4
MENCLANKSPELAKQWNQNKNGNLTPKDVTTGSNKKVWWQCEQGHEWEAVINNRQRKGKGGCPHCRKNKRKV